MYTSFSKAAPSKAAPIGLGLWVLWVAVAVPACASTEADKAVAPTQTQASAPQIAEPAEVLNGPGMEASGRRLYVAYCQPCHGADGDGAGPVADELQPRPREFRRGVYKFRRTPTGALPTDGDLYRTIARGIPGTAMPAWGGQFRSAQIWHIVQYIKTFSPRFSDPAEQPGEDDVVDIPAPPAPSDESIGRGRELYVQFGCTACHGEQARGDGPSSDTLTDYQGRPIAARDFTSDAFKGGGRPTDIYRTIQTGLAGTPMPGYGGLSEQQTWELVYYILSVRAQRSFFDYLFDDEVGRELIRR